MSSKLIMTPWENNAIQFARLLAEVRGVIKAEQLREIAMSMDLDDMTDVFDLFDRADAVWEKVKSQTVDGVYTGSLRLVEDE
jgi:hypothetical protein